MSDELRVRIADARLAVHELTSLRVRLGTLDEAMDEREMELERLDRALASEEKDVCRLEGLGLTAMFATMLGTKDARLVRERAEALKAKLAREACADALTGARADRGELTRRIAALGDPGADLEQLLVEKESALRGAVPSFDARLDEIDEALAHGRGTLKEVDEAVAAADGAIAWLNSVADSLGSAANWGTLDLLGGGLFATAVKHGRIDDARSHAHAAQRALDRFARELKDVSAAQGAPLVVEIGDFLKFADYLFDGLIADWTVQRRIDDSRRNVDATVRRVRGLRTDLVERATELHAEIAALEEERRAVVERA